MRTLICALSFALLAAIPCSAEDKMRIGISTALTGNAATYGTDMKNVFLFANQKLANDRYEFVFDDDKCSGKDAVSIAQRFINIENLKYVGGFACSSTILAAGKLYEQAKILTMITSASAPTISSLGDYIFRTWPSDALFAKVLYEHIRKQGVKKLGILSEQTDYAQAFKAALQKLNTDTAPPLTIINEDFLSDTSDFRTPLLKLKAAGIDALLLNPQAEATFLASMKQVRESAMTIPILNILWAGSANVLNRDSQIVEGVTFVDAPNLDETLTPEGSSLLDEFTKIHGNLQSVGIIFMATFEGFRALNAAIESGKEPRQFLYNTTFHGIFGDWHFDANGDIQGLNPVMKVIKGGKAVTITE